MLAKLLYAGKELYPILKYILNHINLGYFYFQRGYRIDFNE